AVDIFSLGRILYFLLGGREPPEPSRDQDMRPLPQTPAGIVEIIRKCTLRDPALRYQRVSDLLDDLARCGDAADSGQPLGVQTEGPLSPREPPPIRSREHASPPHPDPRPVPRSVDVQRATPADRAAPAALTRSLESARPPTAATSSPPSRPVT